MGEHHRRVRAAAAAFVGVVLALTALPADAATGRRVTTLDRRTATLQRRVVPFNGRVATEGPGLVVTVALDAQVLFEEDEATLTAPAQATLTDVARELNDRLAEPAVRIVGHTDALGSAEHNVDLSNRRAAAVQAFLTPLVTVPVSFRAEGHGEVEPAAPNTKPDGSDDPEGRRRNRRVEIVYTAKPDAPN